MLDCATNKAERNIDTNRYLYHWITHQLWWLVRKISVIGITLRTSTTRIRMI